MGGIAECVYRLITIVAVGVILVVLRITVMGNQRPEFSPSDNPAANSESSLTRVLTFLYLPVFNFWLLLTPQMLSFDWSMDAIPLLESLLDLRCVAIVVFYGLLTITVLHCLARIMHNYWTVMESPTKQQCSAAKQEKNIKTSSKLKSCGSWKTETTQPTSTAATDRSCLPQSTLISLAILVLPFVPACNLFFYVGFVVAERVLYIPSVGFCLLIAVGSDVIWNICKRWQRKVLSGLLLCVLVLLSVKTVQRNWDWQTEETLYRYSNRASCTIPAMYCQIILLN